MKTQPGGQRQRAAAEVVSGGGHAKSLSEKAMFELRPVETDPDQRSEERTFQTEETARSRS